MYHQIFAFRDPGLRRSFFVFNKLKILFQVCGFEARRARCLFLGNEECEEKTLISPLGYACWQGCKDEVEALLSSEQPQHGATKGFSYGPVSGSILQAPKLSLYIFRHSDH